MTFSADVRTFLSSASLGSPVIFVGPVRPPEPPAIPHRVLFVLETGGWGPENYMDGGEAYRQVRIQVRVRGEPNSFQSTQDLAQAVWSQIHQGNVSGYVRCVCEQSTPLYLGRDAQGCYEAVVNGMLSKRSA
jgi:hypothetical protein